MFRRSSERQQPTALVLDSPQGPQLTWVTDTFPHSPGARLCGLILGMIAVSLMFLGSVGSTGYVIEAAEEGENGDVIPGRFIVGLEPSLDPTVVARDHRLKPDKLFKHATRGFASNMTPQKADALRADERVRFVEPDRIVTLEAQEIPTGIGRIFASDNSNLQINGIDDLSVDVDIAIIDTGIDNDHPDLNVVKSVDCRNNCASGGDDGNGHGTHVAGTAAALDNDIGVVGVAPGARLWAVQVLSSSGSGTIADVVAGIDYVTANADAVEVANMSLGCDCTSQALDEAVAASVAAGVSYIVAAGNRGTDAEGHSPANHPDVITVSALADFDGVPAALGSPTCRTDEDDTLADFSNHGSLIEIAAPGVCILSSWKDGGYKTISGTSMAAPHVTGAAALLASGGADVENIRDTLVSTGNRDWVDDSGDGIQEPLLDVSDEAVFGPGLSPSDEYPSLTLTNPAHGETVAGMVAVTAEASDDDAVTQVEVFVDDIVIGTDTDGTDGWSVAWDTTVYADNTRHVIAASATDTAGHVVSQNITVTVNNGDGPPTVELMSHVDGDIVYGEVQVVADATDDVGLERVEFWVDGRRRWYDHGEGATSLTVTWNWDTTSWADGEHSLYVQAVDSVGQTAASSAITIVVDNGNADQAPSVSIVAPDADETVSGTVKITASARDDLGISRLDFAVDGSTISTLFYGSSPTSVEGSTDWDTMSWGDGSHEVSVKATDSAGQTADAMIGVKVNNSTSDSPPTVSVTSPASASSISGSITVEASAGDDNGVSQVEFFVDGLLIGTDVSGSDGWSASWDSSQVEDGTHTVAARATDTAGQTATDSVSVSTENQSTLEITGVDPASITLSASTSIAITISGTGFASGLSVAFESGQGPTPNVAVSSVSSTAIEVTLNFKEGGPPKPREWDVRVTNPGGETDVLVGGFTVYP